MKEAHIPLSFLDAEIVRCSGRNRRRIPKCNTLEVDFATKREQSHPSLETVRLCTTDFLHPHGARLTASLKESRLAEYGTVRLGTSLSNHTSMTAACL